MRVYSFMQLQMWGVSRLWNCCLLFFIYLFYYFFVCLFLMSVSTSWPHIMKKMNGHWKLLKWSNIGATGGHLEKWWLSWNFAWTLKLFEPKEWAIVSTCANFHVCITNWSIFSLISSTKRNNKWVTVQVDAQCLCMLYKHLTTIQHWNQYTMVLCKLW